MSVKSDDIISSLPSGVDWMPVEKVFTYLKAQIEPGKCETILISKALGRVLARPLVAKRAHPPKPNSAVDGYGFAYSSLTNLSNKQQDSEPFLRLKYSKGRAAAGEPFWDEVPAGHAIRILTGAILPRGVDTVILQENTKTDDGYIVSDSLPKKGANTRKDGEDVLKDAVFLQKGHLMRPQDIALGIALGLDKVEVFCQLKIATLSTGSELVEVGKKASSYNIFDANRPMLMAMMDAWGHEGIDLGIVKDDARAIKNTLDYAAKKADFVITTGGASTGDTDHIGKFLSQETENSIWRVALKPGRPLAIGKLYGKLIFGLPGNPVAAFVCALIFLKPALDLMAGAGWSSPLPLMMPAHFSKQKKSGRREYLRARLTKENHVEVFPSEGSGRISGLSWADGLVELEEPAYDIKPGDLVRYFPFSAFGLSSR